MRPATCCVPGSSGAAWITVDDTGARHKSRERASAPRWATPTSPGSGTTGSKSRLNFLTLLRAGQ